MNGKLIFFVVFVIVSVEGKREQNSGSVNKVKDRTATKIKSMKIKADYKDRVKGKCIKLPDGLENVKLRCRKKSVIYTININSYDGNRCNTDMKNVCSGLQALVLIASNRCYSKRSCNIPIDKRYPIARVTNETCIGKIPKVLLVHYRCVKKDLFTVMHKPGGDEARSLTGDSGMIASHDNYPWYYDRDITARVTLTPCSKSKNKLYLTVHSLDIDSTDILNVSASGLETTIVPKDVGNKSLLMPTSVDGTVVKFYTAKSSQGASGFLLCYMFTNADLSQKNICREVEKLKKTTNTKTGKREVRSGKRKKSCSRKSL